MQASCRSSEGWGPLSRLRYFDLTPCFEEGIILPVLLVALLLGSLFRIWSLHVAKTLPRTQNVNRWLLRIKVVSVLCVVQIGGSRILERL